MIDYVTFLWYVLRESFYSKELSGGPSPQIPPSQIQWWGNLGCLFENLLSLSNPLFRDLYSFFFSSYASSFELWEQLISNGSVFLSYSLYSYYFGTYSSRRFLNSSIFRLLNLSVLYCHISHVILWMLGFFQIRPEDRYALGSDMPICSGFFGFFIVK